jgi:hypothetical protein
VLIIPVVDNNILRSTQLTETEINALDSVEVDFQLRGNCYAFSSSSNARPSNGEAHSDNIANPVDNSFPHNGLYLAINEKEFVKIATNIWDIYSTWLILQMIKFNSKRRTVGFTWLQKL